MKARLGSLSTRALVAVAVGSALVYAAALWLLVISPQRATAASLADEVAAAELKLADTRATSTRPHAPGTQVADVFRLVKALPSSADQPGLMLELELLARSTGVTLGSVTPSDPVAAAGGPTSIPVVVTAEGSYRQITRFLKGMTKLVLVRGGDVRAIGRLLAPQSIELAESKARHFPYLDATIALNAFVYDGPIVPVTPPPSTTEDTETTASATAARSTP